MASGLLALLDDVAALVKASAATLDDISAQVAKTGAKVSGVVIDDTAVTPKYVVGLDPKRELSIIYSIAKRSLLNKLLILAPAALVLGYIAPWAITPILMCGGTYLCFEGYEKVHAMFAPGHGDAEDANVAAITPEQLEKLRINSAVQTDMILSAEIIAITYAMVAEDSVLNQILVLAIIAVSITVAVYGFVALLVKMDDIGLYFARTGRSNAVRAIGRAIVKGMPRTLEIIGYIGTAAMLWVGAEIIAHGIAPVHHALEQLQEAIPGSIGWLAKAALCAVGGLIIGALTATVLKLGARLVRQR